MHSQHTHTKRFVYLLAAASGSSGDSHHPERTIGKGYHQTSPLTLSEELCLSERIEGEREEEEEEERKGVGKMGEKRKRSREERKRKGGRGVGW